VEECFITLSDTYRVIVSAFCRGIDRSLVPGVLWEYERKASQVRILLSRPFFP
jgi:hypothetical protein